MMLVRVEKGSVTKQRITTTAHVRCLVVLTCFILALAIESSHGTKMDISRLANSSGELEKISRSKSKSRVLTFRQGEEWQ